MGTELLVGALVSAAIAGTSTAVAANQQKKQAQGAANEQKRAQAASEKLAKEAAPATQTQDNTAANANARRKLRLGVANTLLTGPQGVNSQSALGGKAKLGD